MSDGDQDIPKVPSAAKMSSAIERLVRYNPNSPRLQEMEASAARVRRLGEKVGAQQRELRESMDAVFESQDRERRERLDREIQSLELQQQLVEQQEQLIVQQAALVEEQRRQADDASASHRLNKWILGVAIATGVIGLLALVVAVVALQKM